MMTMHCPRCGHAMAFVEDMHETDYPVDGKSLVDDMTWWCEPCDVRLHVTDTYVRETRVIEVLGLDDDISWGDGEAERDG